MIAFIIYGSRGITSTQGSGQFYCPACKCPCPFEHQSTRRYFTLFFIPIIPLGQASEYVDCSRCGSSFNKSVLQINAPNPAVGMPAIGNPVSDEIVSTEIVETQTIGSGQSQHSLAPSPGSNPGLSSAARKPFDASSLSGHAYLPPPIESGGIKVPLILISAFAGFGLLIVLSLMAMASLGWNQPAPKPNANQFPRDAQPGRGLEAHRDFGGAEAMPAIDPEFMHHDGGGNLTLDSAVVALNSDEEGERNNAAFWLRNQEVVESKRQDIAIALERVASLGGQFDGPALDALETWAAPDNVPRLLSEVASATEPRKRSLLKALGASGDMRAAPVLAESMGTRDAKEGLRGLGPEASSHVLPFLNDPQLRGPASELLEEWNTPIGLQITQSVTDLKSEIAKRVEYAAWFLSRIEFDEAHRSEIGTGLETCLARTDIELCKALPKAMQTWNLGESTATALTTAMSSAAEKEHGFEGEAVKALCATGSDNAVPALISAVLENEYRENALTALKQLNADTVLESAIPFVNIDNISARKSIVKLLNELNTPEEKFLRQCGLDLMADEIERYEAACDWLDDQDVDETFQPGIAKGLAHALTTIIAEPDKHNELRSPIETSRKWGDAVTALALAEVVRSCDQTYATRAISALAVLKVPSTYQVIADELTKDRRSSEAIQALKSLGIGAESVVLPILSSDDQRVRRTVLTVLGEIGGDASLEVLKDRLDSGDIEGSEKFTFESAIQKIERRPASERQAPAIAATLAPASAPDGPVMRSWTSSEGQKIEGKLIAYENNRAHLEVNGEIFKTDLSMLSEADQKYIADEIKKREEAER